MGDRYQTIHSALGNSLNRPKLGGMKANLRKWFLVLLLGSTALQLPAQQSEADRKLLADIRAEAEKGNAQSQFELGEAFRIGNLGLATNYVEAVNWYRKAAEQGNAAGQNALGVCYRMGKGVTKDTAEAVKWYRKAAEQGYAKAQYNLAVCYAEGEGVTKDAVEAAKWFRKAAEQGFADGQLMLGVCYAAGKGVTKDCVEAYKWMSLASAQGDDFWAKAAKSKQAEQMTPEQIARGSRLARDFKPSRELESGASAPSR